MLSKKLYHLIILFLIVSFQSPVDIFAQEETEVVTLPFLAVREKDTAPEKKIVTLHFLSIESEKPQLKKITLMGETGYFIPTDDKIKDIYGKGIIFSGGAKYNIPPNLSIGIALDYWDKSGDVRKIEEMTRKIDEIVKEFQDNYPMAEIKVVTGETTMRIIPVIVTVIYNIPIRGIRKSLFYFGGGPSWYMAKKKIDNTTISAIEDKVVASEIILGKDESKNIFGFHTLMGTNYFLSRRFSVTLEAKYSYTKKVSNWDMKLGGLALAGGFNYTF
ncbi:MAG: hypothetical protein AB1422_11185 [bacterium]